MAAEEYTQERASRQQVVEVVKKVLVYEARVNIAPEQVADDEPLNSDLLRITSLSLLGMIMSLEEMLDISLEDEHFMKARFVTVDDLVKFIYQTYCSQNVEGEVAL